jgi:predicted Zn-dependent protease
MSASPALAREHGFAVPEPQSFAPPRRRQLALVPDAPASASGAAVIRLFAPADPAPLRLTRRGVGAVAIAIVVLSVSLVLVAARSAPTPARSAAPARVTVQPGDTLWAVAARIAPQTDPREEVATLRALNRLRTSTLQPGQVLRTR